MANTETEDQSAVTLTLDEEIGVAQVPELRDRLLELAAMQSDVAIDAKAVSSVETSTLQLLLAFVRSVELGGNHVTWEPPSDVFSRQVGLCGLGDELGVI
ncbi:MAG: lipid asymmetry maintenance protein MlaB [Halioglobus sp.]